MIINDLDEYTNIFSRTLTRPHTKDTPLPVLNTYNHTCALHAFPTTTHCVSKLDYEHAADTRRPNLPESIEELFGLVQQIAEICDRLPLA